MEMEGCRAIVVPSTECELSPCVETRGPNTRRNRAMRYIENIFSAPLAAYGGPSVPGMRDSSSKGGRYIQDMIWSTPMICCAVHALNNIDT